MTPQTTVLLLSDIPLDNGYQHTLWFDSQSQQETYFKSKKWLEFDNTTVQRINNKTFKANTSQASAMTCNYLMFQNKGYSTKWWYAFITDVRYISDTMTEIDFEIDVMQSYLFTASIPPCFVEREHVANDTIGLNTVPEGLFYGDYQFEGSSFSGAFGDGPNNVSINADGTCNPNWYIAIAAASSSDDIYLAGTAYGNIYSGIKIVHCNSIQSANKYLKDLAAANRMDSVVAVYMSPTAFQEPISGFEPKIVDKKITKNYGSMDGYTPRNKKLYCYPYYFLWVTNNNGNSNEYPYEYFKDDEIHFDIVGTDEPNAQIMAIPKGYKGVNGRNYNEYITLPPLPTCSYLNDFYKAWLAQEKASTPILHMSTATGAAETVLAGGVALGTAALTGGASLAGMAAGAAVGALTQIKDHFTASNQAKITPNTMRGNQGANILYSLDHYDFKFVKTTIRAEYAKQLDDFFDMFGYKINRVKTLQRSARPQWNYVKTQGCTVKGNIAMQDRKKIQDCYDRGITFWKNPANVGQYNLNNKAVS